MSEDRTITILNAFNLEKIQIVKDVGTLHSVRYTASAFDTTEGRLWCTCQRMTEWEFGIDDEVEIKALQTSTLMKHMLQQRKMGELIRLAKLYSKSSVPTISYKKNENVLISRKSNLVEVLVSSNPDANDPYRIIITIDSQNLVR